MLLIFVIWLWSWILMRFLYYVADEIFRSLFLSKSTSIYSNNEECEYIYMNFPILSTVSIWNLRPQIFLLFKLCSAPKGYHSLTLRRKRVVHLIHWRKNWLASCLLKIFRLDKICKILFFGLKIEIGKREAWLLFCCYCSDPLFFFNLFID
jgi:hypothetical protein